MVLVLGSVFLLLGFLNMALSSDLQRGATAAGWIFVALTLVPLLLGGAFGVLAFAQRLPRDQVG